MTCKRELIGEVLGTFMLVLFGCGPVAVSVLFGAHHGLMQVALVWGSGTVLAGLVLYALFAPSIAAQPTECNCKPDQR